MANMSDMTPKPIKINPAASFSVRSANSKIGIGIVAEAATVTNAKTRPNILSGVCSCKTVLACTEINTAEIPTDIETNIVIIRKIGCGCTSCAETPRIKIIKPKRTVP